MATFDVVIRGASVADGTGSPRRSADVAIKDGVIAEVGKVVGSGQQEISADGALVTPGWVDVHTHYDGQAVWDSRLAPSSNLGVTTVAFGNCGVGFAPVDPSRHDELVHVMEGVEDIPGTALHEGLTWEWETFPQYLEALERIPHDVDFAAYVPHGALRVYTMGERGIAGEEATERDIEQMANITRAAVAAGALGFSTSRTINHRSSTGQYIPSLRATVAELRGIASAVGTTGKGLVQVVSDFDDLDAEWPVLVAMAQASGRPLTLSVTEQSASAVVDETRASLIGSAVLERITVARATGLMMTAQVAPRPIGLIMGLSATLHPFMQCAAYQKIANLPLNEQVTALRHGEIRRLLLDTYAGETAANKTGGSAIARFHRMVRLDDPPDYEQGPDASISAIAARQGRAPEEVALDVMLEDDGQGLLYVPVINYERWNLDEVRAMLVHPFAVPGLSDGGAHVGTICDASFATTLLSHWGCRRPTGRLPVEFLVERQTRACARLLGMNDRGVIAPGYRADINAIDLDKLQVRRPTLHWDLPSGGRRFLQKADGYLHTFVAGVETYRDSQPTGALPGRLVRGTTAAA